MKRIFKTILPLTLLLLGSCAEELNEAGPVSSRDRVAPEGYALVDFTVNVPNEIARTKAFSDEPNISSLRVAVFDEYYYLEDYVVATSKGPVGSPSDNSYPDRNYDGENEGTTTWSYQVTLPTSNEYRIIHFIANGPENLSFGSEVEVIGDLVTSGDQDAYWQRIELEHGIVADASGQLIASTAAQLSGIKLIRNFAKISVTASPKETSNFELEYAYVMNNATSGTIAPYCSSSRDFIENYQDYTTDELSSLFNYDAWMPAEYSLNSAVPANAGVNPGEWIAPGSNGYASTFIYEREKPNANPVIILIYGKYYSDIEHNPSSYTECYYKVDMKNTDEKYFPIMRNVNYKINIRKVSTVGRTTVREAIDMPGSGDVSTAIENEGLTNISDGISRIVVSFTDTTVVTGNPITLKYKFIPDFSNNPSDYDNTNVPASQQANASGRRVSITTTPDDGASGMFSFTVGTETDAAGYNTITIDPVDPGTLTRTQKLSIKGIAIDGSIIRREITIVLRQKDNLLLYCDPSTIRNEAGTEFDVVLRIPGGLSRMIFPLEIKIESDKMSIVPAKGDNLPVESGRSIILSNPETPGDETTTNKPAFYFIKTVSWADYDSVPLSDDATKHIVCHFKSNTANSATRIWAANRYFYSGYTDLENFSAKNFSNLQFTAGSNFDAGRSVGFSFGFESTESFQALDGGEITVTLVGLEPADGNTDLTPLQPSAAIPGGYEYSYTPSDRASNVLSLASSSSSGPKAVYLDHTLFNQGVCRRVRTVTIANNALTFTNSTTNQLFGNKYSTAVNGQVLIRESEYDSDMTSAPNCGVNTTTSGNNNNRTYTFKSQAVSAFEVDASADRLFFLYDLNGTVYSGSIAITPGTTSLNLTGTVSFSARKTQGVLEIEDMELGVAEHQTANVVRNTNGAITYTSSDPDIATITAEGVVTGISSGVTTITATTAATATYSAASCTFTVKISRPSISVSISDQVNGNVKSNLLITNTGSKKAYIRAAIVAAWYDESGSVVAPWDESQGLFKTLAPSGWTKEEDGIYYYDYAVNPESRPANPLFDQYTKPSTPPVPGAHLEMTVMVQAIPYDEHRTCPEAFTNLVL